MRAAGVALVTGASRGIGRAVAVELADRGFDVVATMRDPAAGDGLPASIRVEQLDVTDLDRFAPPDGLRVLVNNAGVEQENLPVEETPLEHWRAEFETNVFGLVEVTRRAVPALRASGGGVVCNVTSSSLLVPMPFFAAYRASKAAVSAFGESLQAELAPHGIRVVEVMPGPIDTDMLASSSSIPEAARFEPYRPLAQLVGEARDATIGAATPAEDAARAIVDAIVDDGAPLRVACDPLGASLLDAWHAATGEDLLRAYLAGFRPPDA